MSRKRVVITGMGVISAAGIGRESSWTAVLNGTPGVSLLSSFDTSSFPIKIAAEVKNFRPEAYIEDKKIIGRISKGDEYGLAAAKIAMDDAGLALGNNNHARGGIYLGCGKEIGTPQALFPALADSMNGDGPVDRRKFGEEAMKQTYPLFLIKDLPNALLFYISRMYKLQGVNSNIVVGGTSSSQAVGDAFRAIQYGESDFILAGGFDSRIDPINLSFLCDSGMLSTRNSEPGKVYSPFDATRDGAVFGEGAGMLVLEELDHALARGARIYAELAGYAAFCNPAEVIRQENDGDSLASAITGALWDAAKTPQHIDYIKANGEGTPEGDRSETLSIKTALGQAAYNIPVSSIKPVIGHLIAASGAVELIITIMAINEDKAPPTINYKYADPTCDLDYVPNHARAVKINTALSINRCSLSGRSTAIVVKRYSDSSST